MLIACVVVLWGIWTHDPRQASKYLYIYLHEYCTSKPKGERPEKEDNAIIFTFITLTLTGQGDEAKTQ